MPILTRNQGSGFARRRIRPLRNEAVGGGNGARERPAVGDPSRTRH